MDRENREGDRQGHNRIDYHGTGLISSGKGRRKKKQGKGEKIPRFPRQDTFPVPAVVIGKPLFDLFPTYGTVLLVFALEIGHRQAETLVRRPRGRLATNGLVRKSAESPRMAHENSS
jgi:hypothetical protein